MYGSVLCFMCLLFVTSESAVGLHINIIGYTFALVVSMTVGVCCIVCWFDCNLVASIFSDTGQFLGYVWPTDIDN